MILAFFRGRGDWFHKYGSGINQGCRIQDLNEWDELELSMDYSLYRDFLSPRYCQEFYGIFKLTEEDELTYRHCRNFDTTKIKKLLPCFHPGSAFLTMALEKGLSEEDAEYCYFKIQTRERWQDKVIKHHNLLEIINLNDSSNTKNTANVESITQTERSTMLKLIIGMAMDAYEYDPQSTRNSATGDKNGISAKLLCHGIEVTDDTIRKYLNEAKKLLPDQEQ